MGAGGVGAYLGARLAIGGADVHLIARGAHLAAMRDRGAHDRHAGGRAIDGRVQATDDPARSARLTSCSSS